MAPAADMGVVVVENRRCQSPAVGENKETWWAEECSGNQSKGAQR